MRRRTPAERLDHGPEPRSAGGVRDDGRGPATQARREHAAGWSGRARAPGPTLLLSRASCGRRAGHSEVGRSPARRSPGRARGPSRSSPGASGPRRQISGMRSPQLPWLGARRDELSRPPRGRRRRRPARRPPCPSLRTVISERGDRRRTRTLRLQRALGHARDRGGRRVGGGRLGLGAAGSGDGDRLGVGREAVDEAADARAGARA